MSMAHSVRSSLRRFGVDLRRWPKESDEYAMHRALMSCRPDAVLDIGANGGQFAGRTRAFGYTGEMISFEPSSQARSRLTAVANEDTSWSVEPYALGDKDGQATLNLAGNDQMSSSLLPMGDLHAAAAPTSSYVGTEVVQILRLDTWMAEHRKASWSRIAMKIDVQGFERAVLEGAADTLTGIDAVRLELSCRHLYDGDWLWTDAAAWMTERGFVLGCVAPGFTDSRTGIMLQFDAVFVRPAD